MKPKAIQVQCVSYSIAADWYEGNDNILLVLPGFTSSKANYGELVSAIVEKTGTSALAIDYSGHGESPFDIQDIQSPKTSQK
jgi:esterase/lipase